MKIKILTRAPRFPEYTLLELVEQKYIGCIDRESTGSQPVRLHLVFCGDANHYHFVANTNVWISTPKTTMQAINHQYSRHCDFYVFESAEELLRWKAGIDA